MLYPVKNAEAFNLGKITDFSQVGFKALDDYTLEVTLHSPAPYLLSMMIHDSWFPVPVAVIEKHGALDDRTNPWTTPGKFRGQRSVCFEGMADELPYSGGEKPDLLGREKCAAEQNLF